MYDFTIQLRDSRIKSLIIDGLCEMVKYKHYPHSFLDENVIWTVWEDHLIINFDMNVPQQKELYDIIPGYYKGPDHKILLKISHFVKVIYPNIVSSRLLRTVSMGDSSGYIYVYHWEVRLSDDTSIAYENTVSRMDLIKGEPYYNKIIQQRALVKYLWTMNMSLASKS